MKTKDHAQLCAAALAGHAVLELLALGLLLLIFGVGWAVAEPELQREMARNHADPAAAKFASGMLVLILGLAGCLLVVRVGLGIAAAIGVWKARPWGKIVGVISSALSCLSFPIGTAVGAYGLWFILGPRGAEWFHGGGTPPIAPIVSGPPGASSP